jgi:hypothetical protein
MTRILKGSHRGSAMLVTMILVSSLLAAGGTLVGLELSSVKAGAAQRGGLSALYCAEAGLAKARDAVAANYAQWSASLATYPSTDEPSWLAAAIGSHDLDGDGVADFTVYIKDDLDEQSPLANDMTHDNNMRVFVVAKCISNPETPREIEELIEVTGGGTCYKTQFGGCHNDGNTN